MTMRDNFRTASDAARRAKTHGEESLEMYEAARKAIEETRMLLESVAENKRKTGEQPE